jgi:hypothetical protein
LASSFEHTLRWPHPHVAKATLRFGRLDCIQNSFRQNLHTILITYLGPELEHIMWLVVQHSTPEFMERYLPVVAEAVHANELQPAPLKMLIDRIYWIQTKQQIFGSQAGVPLADKKTIEKVQKKYQLE